MSNIQTDLFTKAKNLVPGGVHSPVRSFKGLHTTPRFFKSAEGAYITDVEDKNYIDFCMSFGPMILGHRNPKVERALQEGLTRGWSYGACEPYSLELVEYLLSRLPHVEQLRFVNSGTEAVMTALRLARFFGTSADFWLNLQVRWDLYKAQQSEELELADIQDYTHWKKLA